MTDRTFGHEEAAALRRWRESADALPPVSPVARHLTNAGRRVNALERERDEWRALADQLALEVVEWRSRFVNLELRYERQRDGRFSVVVALATVGFACGLFVAGLR